MARSQDKETSEKQESDYIKQFTFHDEEINKDVEAWYNPKEKDCAKAWIRKVVK